MAGRRVGVSPPASEVEALERTENRPPTSSPGSSAEIGDLSRVLYGLGIRFVGEKTAQLLADAYPQIET